MKIRVVKVDEMHDDVVKGDEGCQYSENATEDKAIIIKIGNAVSIAGNNAVGRVRLL